MCVYICVCVCVYICICVCVCVYIYIYIYIYIHSLNQALSIYHQNICDLGTKMNDLLASLYPNLPQILC